LYGFINRFVNSSLYVPALIAALRLTLTHAILCGDKDGGTMRIGICDDMPEDSGFIQKLVTDWAKTRQTAVQTEVFSSAEAFLFRYAETKFDLLLLDIEMGDANHTNHMDGVTMAKRIRQEDEAVQIIFITGYSDYIAEGYEVAALHYLMKPVNPEKLFSVLDRAADKLRRNERMLHLEISGELVRIPFSTLKYLDVFRNYVTLHAREDYTVKRPLTELEKELDNRFFRVGRSLIINLEHIRRVTKTEIVLDSDEHLPLPRGAYAPLNQAIIQHD